MTLPCAIAGAAKADDCKPLQYYTGVPMSVDRGALLVPVTLNQKPAMMMFDTGGVTSQLSRGTVEALKLQEMETTFQLLDVSGDTSHTAVRVENFSIGKLQVSHLQFQVAPMKSLDRDNIAGLLSNNFLHVFDVDLDFGSGRMNFFLPDHCPGNVVYWPVTAAASVPIEVDTNHMVVPVTVDGHPMRATIDTGASRTTMNMDDAVRLYGLTPDTPDTPALNNHLNGDQNLPSYRHTFATLSFEGVTVKNPAMVILPDRVNAKEQLDLTGSHIANAHIKLPELIIGLDILRKLHVYISYKERMLYIAQADDKAGKLLPAVTGPGLEPSPAASTASPP